MAQTRGEITDMIINIHATDDLIEFEKGSMTEARGVAASIFQGFSRKVGISWVAPDVSTLDKARAVAREYLGDESEQFLDNVSEALVILWKKHGGQNDQA